jgi:hypothetical protein
MRFPVADNISIKPELLCMIREQHWIEALTLFVLFKGLDLGA